jgi:hypothetical protein
MLNGVLRARRHSSPEVRRTVPGAVLQAHSGRSLWSSKCSTRATSQKAMRGYLADESPSRLRIRLRRTRNSPLQISRVLCISCPWQRGRMGFRILEVRAALAAMGWPAWLC